MIDKSILEIDAFALEKECIRQPQIYFEWAKNTADARRDWDVAKSALDVTRAELDREVRSHPEVLVEDGKKLTEKMIEASIVVDTRYVGIVKKVNNARHRYEVASAMVSALDHKKAAIGKLVDLQLSSYYAEPRTRANREHVEEMKKNQAFKSKEEREGSKRGNDE